MEQRPLRGPKLAWVQEEEEGPGAAPIEEIKEVVRFKTLQEDAAVDRTQEQDPARGLFRRTVEVPAMVRYIHQWLMDNQFAEQRLKRALLDLTEEQPADVVMTLLCVAPSCDRAAFTMWKSIMCSPRTAEPVQLMLLDVLGSWPEHSTFTSDGGKTGVFVLAVSFCNWPLLAPRPPAQQLSILLAPLHLPASGAGLKPGHGAASGAPGPLLLLRLPGPLPPVLGPCHTDTSALSAV
ncbi:uncharacterized protein LOC128820918 [Vidua macroura]|uniref:uncharacterized protein LOC128820918 n=1 Tax=Vidua macroura TaxID=187451 RepID=UPI0023A83A70|nr:uncharacterized protein LOC128820918 [Vidua macroura]